MSESQGPTKGDIAAAFSEALLATWVGLGLSHCVICPGSRSTPLALAAIRTTGLSCHIVHDERSGAFLALGIGAESRVPALVLCTSGTAAVHFHAAVVEADLAAVPLLVATADRPPALQGVYAPQTINQNNLYGQSVRWFSEPGVPTTGDQSVWADLAREAHARTLGPVPGPVHLNLAFDEPLLGSSESVTGPVAAGVGTARAEVRSNHTSDAGGQVALEQVTEAIRGRRGVILAGARTALDATEAAAVLGLAEAFGWPVLADASSGVRIPHPNVVSTFDLLLRNEDFRVAHQPEVAIRFGGLLTSKVTAQWLADGSDRVVKQIGIDRFGRCPDPDRLLELSVCCVPAVAAERLSAMETAAREASGVGDSRWLFGWAHAEEVARAAVDRAQMGHGEVGEPGLAMDVMRLVPPGGNLVVSSSMPVRDLEWFAAPRSDVRVFSNRGANGIDGVTSTAIGVALSSGRPTVLLTGDVAFLHDSAALTALRRRAVDLVIVVVHNDGGGIFSFLPQAGELPGSEFEALFGTPHGTDLAALAAAHGLAAEQVRTRAGATAALAAALHQGGPRVVVALSNRQHNVAVHHRLHSAVADALGHAR